VSDRTDEQKQIESELGGGAYGADLLDEPSRPRDDRGDPDPDALTSTIDASVDPEVLRNGGPTRTPGMMTTTGGNAGPNSIKHHPNRIKGQVPLTTTGDATTSGMETPDRTSTSDASSNAIE
jgi:hypothetical protein